MKLNRNKMHWNKMISVHFSWSHNIRDCFHLFARLQYQKWIYVRQKCWAKKKKIQIVIQILPPSSISSRISPLLYDFSFNIKYTIEIRCMYTLTILNVQCYCSNSNWKKKKTIQIWYIQIDIICIKKKKTASTGAKTIAVVSYDMNAFATFHYIQFKGMNGAHWTQVILSHNRIAKKKKRNVMAKYRYQNSIDTNIENVPNYDICGFHTPNNITICIQNHRIWSKQSENYFFFFYFHESS